MEKTKTLGKCQLTIKSIIIVLVFVLSSIIKAQLTYSFITSGATGNVGPTQTELNIAYASTNLNGSVSSVGGIQTWTVPFTGYYFIEARGAEGGGLNSIKYGGKGASMKGKFLLNCGTVLKILVGQQGSSTFNCYGGGGGSFVSTFSNTPLVVAGGGGGAGGLGGGNGADASIGNAGTSGIAGGAGGSNGDGGTAINTNGGAGAGFYTDGSGFFYMPECSTTVGKSFVNGGMGGQFDDWMPGGFGGGGSGWSGNGNGGGGGGYSGGGTSGSSFLGGGGGGSYNSGLSQINTQGANTGDGLVLISYIFHVDVVQNASVPCYGYSTTVLSSSVNGGTPPYSYNWAPISNTNSIATGIGAGVYTLSVTDANNLTTKSTYTVTQPNGFTITAAASKTLICKGDSVILSASGATSYTWSNNMSNSQWFNPNSTSVFTVNGTFNGCNSSATVHIGVNPLPQISVSGSSLICNGASALITANGATTYTWLSGGNDSTIAVSPSTNTIYVVSGTNNQGCINTYSFDISVDNCTGLNSALEKNRLQPLKLYPNPNDGIFTIELSDEEGLIIITDLVGKTVFTTNVEKVNKIDLWQLTNGLYLVKLVNKDKIYHQGSFIKQ